ncbi:MAG: GDYXXLXY domain-containing protein [Capnocytophaga sp.]|nr:GDYXXLXY domain-containing protein [Capnocytophaga sp.]
MAKKYLVIAFVAMVLLQLLFPLKMILDREIILEKGHTFLFKIRPIDPYDAFRGRYVTINYEEDRVMLPFSMHRKDNISEIYITLTADSLGRVVFKDITETKPTSTDIYMKVPVTYVTDDGEALIEIQDNRYYMNENKAPIAERIVKEGYAQVVVYKGKTILKGILIEGIPIEKYIDLDKSSLQETNNFELEVFDE